MVITKMFNTTLCTRLFILTCPFTTQLYAADWKMNAGVHDFFVAQESSHTFGAGVGLVVLHTTENEILLTGSVDAFIDRDKDELDQDHIPIWYQFKLLSKALLARLSKDVSVNWLIDIKGRCNTVSAVEQEFKLMPGVNLQYDSPSLSIASTFLTGYYFLEIDDDAPKPRGYAREDLQNKSGAMSLRADVRFALREKLEMNASAQQWHDGDAWLENQYAFSLVYNTTDWIKKSSTIISAVYTKYNLDPYDNKPASAPDYQAILAWDNDMVIRAYISFPLGW